MGNMNSASNEVLWAKGVQMKRKGFDKLSKFLKEQHYRSTPTARAIDKFSTKFLQLLHDSSERKNQVASALGIELLLAMYVEGVTACTHVGQLMESPLDINTDQKLNYTALTKKLSSIDKDSFIFASKIYLKEGSAFPFFLPNFRRIISSYKMEMESIDFDTPFEAAGIMNRWAYIKTKNKIKRPVPAIFLRQDMLSTVLNVIFFKGHWRVNFDVKDTRNLIFFLDEERAVQKPIMTICDKKYLRYSESKIFGARLLEIPYREEGFRMVIFLPDKVDGLSDVINRANRYGLLDEINRVASPNVEVHLRLPKFRVETDTDMDMLLVKFGTINVSNKKNPMTNVLTRTDKVVDQYFQKAVIEVDEKGTNVDAGTVETTRAERRLSSSPSKHILFYVDHPFLFVLLYENIILLVGTYAG